MFKCVVVWLTNRLKPLSPFSSDLFLLQPNMFTPRDERVVLSSNLNKLCCFCFVWNVCAVYIGLVSLIFKYFKLLIKSWSATNCSLSCFPWVMPFPTGGQQITLTYIVLAQTHSPFLRCSTLLLPRIVMNGSSSVPNLPSPASNKAWNVRHTQETLCTWRDLFTPAAQEWQPWWRSLYRAKMRKAFSIRLCYDREIRVLHLRLYACCSYQVLICANDAITLILNV